MSEEFTLGGHVEARASSAQTIKVVPPEHAVRARIRQVAFRKAEELDHRQPICRRRIEEVAESVLAELGLPRSYLGWTMVAVGSAFWRPMVMSVPYHRRLLLLPHCMRNSAICGARYTAEGLQCQVCGGCSLGWLGETARAKGYRVLIAEGSPHVLRLILQGEADALLGVACLNSLEQSLDRVLMAGIPCMAIPLVVDNCRDTASDEDWILEMIETPYLEQGFKGRSYLPLMRLAINIVEGEIDRLCSQRPSPGQDQGAFESLTITEQLALQYVLEGGKYYRPFVVLGTHDALNGHYATSDGPMAKTLQIPSSVQQVALAVEVFHKASVVHDDIEDADPFRYGRPTLHERWGMPVALNIGDYLIGLGYSLLANAGATLDGSAGTDLLRLFSRAHSELCTGQGAELWLTRSPQQAVSIPEVLRIYALKTGAAFEAAVLAAIRLGGPLPDWQGAVRTFARAFGIAFQIQNDYQDWKGQSHNKRRVGGDAVAQRPTIFAAIAWHRDPEAFAHLLQSTVDGEAAPAGRRVSALREFFERIGVFQMGKELFKLERDRAFHAAEAIPDENLRTFLQYLTESALHWPSAES